MIFTKVCSSQTTPQARLTDGPARAGTGNAGAMLSGWAGRGAPLQRDGIHGALLGLNASSIREECATAHEPRLTISLIVPALGIALNPMPIIAVVALLSTDHSKRNASAFLASLVAVMLTVGVLTIFVLASKSSQSSATTTQAAVQTPAGLFFPAHTLGDPPRGRETSRSACHCAIT